MNGTMLLSLAFGWLIGTVLANVSFFMFEEQIFGFMDRCHDSIQAWLKKK